MTEGPGKGHFLVRAFAVTSVLAAPAGAQTMRDFEYGRPLRGEKQLRAVIEFAAGVLELRPGPDNRLYHLGLSYDAERFRPIGRYNSDAAEVHLGVDAIGGGGIRVDRRRALPQAAEVRLPANVDLTLDVSLGATEGTLELGGMRLASLEVKTGASRTDIKFGTPTTGSCRFAAISSGAGEVTVTEAGNSGCRSWRVDGGVGNVTLDLGGAWPADARMTLSMALGRVTLGAPKDLGLRVRVTGFLAGFAADGFRKSGKTYTSANYENARRRLDVEVTSAMGGVEIVWK